MIIQNVGCYFICFAVMGKYDHLESNNNICFFNIYGFKEDVCVSYLASSLKKNQNKIVLICESIVKIRLCLKIIKIKQCCIKQNKTNLRLQS